MAKLLSDDEMRQIADFQHSVDYAKIPESARKTFEENLDSPGQLVFVHNIIDQLTNVENEEWRGKNGQEEMRRWIICERAPRVIDDILNQQKAGDSWIERLKGEATQTKNL
jgi:hypothetical protein